MSNRRDSTALVSMQARRFKKQSYDCELLSSPATTRYSIFAYSLFPILQSKYLLPTLSNTHAK